MTGGTFYHIYCPAHLSFGPDCSHRRADFFLRKNNQGYKYFLPPSIALYPNSIPDIPKHQKPMSVLNQRHFRCEKAAYRFIESKLWPDGRYCPHCGTYDKSSPLKGKTTRIGLYKCYACRKPFTVKMGTIFEHSHIKLHIWLQALYMISASKKGISSSQLSRVLGITMKSAWFLSHRIRESMKDISALLGGQGSIVEADETYLWLKKNKTTVTTRGRPFIKSRYGSGPSNKRPIIAMVERNGKARSFHVDQAYKSTVVSLVKGNVDKSSDLYTDESRLYSGADSYFNRHESVRHSAREYARGKIHTNSIEGFFGIIKRGMKGIYHYCSEHHMQRYLYEFDFRYNYRQALGYDDQQRAEELLKKCRGKRLTYKQLIGKKSE